MTVGEARAAARQWVVEEAAGSPDFRGAYTAGSTNWLPDDAPVAPDSDFDVMVVVTDPSRAGRRGKFRYRGVLLEASYLGEDQLRSADAVLGDYHLAPSLRTATILADPAEQLGELQASVRGEYAKPHWIRRRCADARDKVLRHLRSIDAAAALHDQAMGCLFGTGVTTHVLLAAGLRNPTIRGRYVAVRELLAERGRLEFQETLLELLGAARIGPERVRQHVATLAEIFDRTAAAMRTPLPFASDLSVAARPIAIDGSLGWIERGYHREAMFWVAVTHSRCQKALATDAPKELTAEIRRSYAEVLHDLGIASAAAIQQRRGEVESALPRVWDLAEEIIAGTA